LEILDTLRIVRIADALRVITNGQKATSEKKIMNSPPKSLFIKGFACQKNKLFNPTPAGHAPANCRTFNLTATSDIGADIATTA